MCQVCQACQVQSGMSGSPVTVRASVSLLGRWFAALCLTELGTLWGQMMFWLAWCCKHSATELLQPLDLACGTLLRSSCAIHTSPMDCSDDSWRDIFFGKHEHSVLCSALEKHLLTYLLNGLAVKKNTSIWRQWQTLYSAAESRAMASVKCRSCSLALLEVVAVMLDSDLRCNRLSTSESCFVDVVGRTGLDCWSFTARSWTYLGWHRKRNFCNTHIYQENFTYSQHICLHKLKTKWFRTTGKPENLD